MTVVTCVEDLRRIAARRVPRMFYEYVAGGSYSESTLHANETDLQKLIFRQRVLQGVPKRDTTTTILGQTISMPVALGPVGLAGMQHGDGEILAARAAEAAGIPFCLSTMSICSIEDVAAAVTKPFWFQLYVMKDRGFVRALIERVEAVKCPVMFVTVDGGARAERHCDTRNGLSVPPRLRLNNILDMATKARWGISMLRTRHRSFGNLAGHVKGMDGTISLANWSAGQTESTLGWKDIEWVRGLWPHKLVVKGLLDPEDARAAVAAGADGLVVSNHGGRQLDGALSTIAALPKVVEAVGTKIEVMMDGGIRTGQDVVRALALGARTCLLGRAYTYGLGAAGERGVAQAIEFIRKELDVTMALTGVSRVADIDRRVLAD